MKILVTGGAGFIGSNLVDKLIDVGHEVVVIDNLWTGKIKNVNKNARLYINDICSNEIFKIFKIEKFDIVYHQAAQIDVQKSISNPCLDCDVNIKGTINILEASVKNDVKKIVYSSSAAIYGKPKYLGIDENHPANPISFYGISKYAPEYYIKTYNSLYDIDYTILRYANAYGIRQERKGEGGVIPIFMDKLFNNEAPIVFGDGSATRDFIYVDDVVEANIKALDRGGGEVLNIGTGKPTFIIGLYMEMKNIIGSDIKVIHEEERKGDIKHSYFNIDRAKNVLSWEAKYSLEEGLNKTIEYYLKLFKERKRYEVAATIY